ncbi:hypothetical protein GCM10023187_51040 [Nibrella viscosa]|uniref:Uncharacterized protein n=1 Tax=Nibrella viscosa TaxID=1084524 RepID=A0ABP8KX94_9BACT
MGTQFTGKASETWCLAGKQLTKSVWGPARLADNLQKWEFIRWDFPFTVIDNHECSVWELMLANGFDA